MAILSAIMGFFFGGAGYLILWLMGIDGAFYLSVMCGSLFAACLFVFFVVYEKWMGSRYAKVEQSIQAPIVCVANGNFTLDNGKMRNGNIYFCENEIVYAFMEEKPFVQTTIPRENIDHFEMERNNLYVFLKNGNRVSIMIPEIRDVVSVLRENGWIE